MPQLDQVTFLSQFFWLTLFYLGFYLLVLKHFLPKLSRILKYRKEKVAPLLADKVAVAGEKGKKISTSFDALFARGVGESRKVFDMALQRSKDWLKGALFDTNKTDYQTTNLIYIHNLGQAFLSQQLAFNLLYRLPFKVAAFSISSILVLGEQ